MRRSGEHAPCVRCRNVTREHRRGGSLLVRACAASRRLDAQLLQNHSPSSFSPRQGQMSLYGRASAGGADGTAFSTPLAPAVARARAVASQPPGGFQGGLMLRGLCIGACVVCIECALALGCGGSPSPNSGWSAGSDAGTITVLADEGRWHGPLSAVPRRAPGSSIFTQLVLRRPDRNADA